MFVYHLFPPVFMYVYILSYFVNKLEIWWLYISPIEKAKSHQLLDVMQSLICAKLTLAHYISYVFD